MSDMVEQLRDIAEELPSQIRRTYSSGETKELPNDLIEDAADEIERLRAQLVDAQADVLRLHREKCDRYMRAITAESQLASARKALEEYGQHTVHCDYDRPGDPKCTCGFSDEISALTDE